MKTIRNLKWFERLILLAVIMTGLGVLVAANYQTLHPLSRCTMTFAAGDTTKSCTVGVEGENALTHSIKITMPNFTTTPTATFSIKDPAGSTLYSMAGITENGVTYIPVERPLTVGSTFTILLTTTGGTGGGTAYVDTYIWR